MAMTGMEMQIAAMIAQALGVGIGASGQAKAANRQAALQERGVRQSEGEGAMNAARRQSQMPMVDKAQYMVNARLGMPPAQFRPNDIYNRTQGAPNMGGLPPGFYEDALREYKPGSGGTSREQQVIEQYLSTLGYGLGGKRAPGGLQSFQWRGPSAPPPMGGR